MRGCAIRGWGAKAVGKVCWRGAQSGESERRSTQAASSRGSGAQQARRHGPRATRLFALLHAALLRALPLLPGQQHDVHKLLAPHRSIAERASRGRAVPRRAASHLHHRHRSSSPSPRGPRHCCCALQRPFRLQLEYEVGDCKTACVAGRRAGQARMYGAPLTLLESVTLRSGGERARAVCASAAAAAAAAARFQHSGRRPSFPPNRRLPSTLSLAPLTQSRAPSLLGPASSPQQPRASRGPAGPTRGAHSSPKRTAVPGQNPEPTVQTQHQPAGSSAYTGKKNTDALQLSACLLNLSTLTVCVCVNVRVSLFSRGLQNCFFLQRRRARGLRCAASPVRLSLAHSLVLRVRVQRAAAASAHTGSRVQGGGDERRMRRRGWIDGLLKRMDDEMLLKTSRGGFAIAKNQGGGASATDAAREKEREREREGEGESQKKRGWVRDRRWKRRERSER